jgi:hypothetical protein
VITVSLGRGGGTFQGAVGFSVPASDATPLVAGDFNGDGRPDLAQHQSQPNAPTGVSVLLNQDLPAAALVTGATTPGSAFSTPVNQVRGFAAAGTAGTVLFAFDPYPDVTVAGVRVARADLTGDGIPDIITAPGPNLTAAEPAAPVRVFDGKTGWQIPGPLGSFLPYTAQWLGGEFVAAGDLNGDGTPDLVTGADAGGGPHVRVFDGKTGQDLLFAGHPDLLHGFYAYDPAFGGGVRVAVADVNGDGQPDIITGAGPSGGPHVRVFDGRTLDEIILNGTPGFAHGFYAFDMSFPGGVYVAAADMNGDGKADLIVGAGSNTSQVRVFSGADGSVLRDFQAYPPDSGMSVAAADVNHDGTPDLITAAGQAGGSTVTVYNGMAADLLNPLAMFEPYPNVPFGGVSVSG